MALELICYLNFGFLNMVRGGHFMSQNGHWSTNHHTRIPDRKRRLGWGGERFSAEVALFREFFWKPQPIVYSSLARGAEKHFLTAAPPAQGLCQKGGGENGHRTGSGGRAPSLGLGGGGLTGRFFSAPVCFVHSTRHRVSPPKTVSSPGGGAWKVGPITAD